MDRISIFGYIVSIEIVCVYVRLWHEWNRNYRKLIEMLHNNKLKKKNHHHRLSIDIECIIELSASVDC